MRIGIYLGRHTGSGGGIGVYARAFVQQSFALLEQRGQEETEVVFYGTQDVLNSELVNQLDLSPILFVRGGASFIWGAGNYFHRLPNGARCRVMLRFLPELFGRYGDMLLDQLLLPLLALRDRVQLLHCLANSAILAFFRPQLATVHDLYQAWPPQTGDRQKWSSGKWFAVGHLKNRISSSPAAKCLTKSEALQGRDGKIKNNSPQSFWQLLTRGYYRALFAAQFRLLSQVITDTEEVAAEVYRTYHFDRGRISVVPLGLDSCFGDFSELLGNPKELVRGSGAFLQKYHLTPGYVLAFASNDPRKNTPRTMAAWEMLEPAWQKADLVLKSADKASALKATECLSAESACRIHLLDWLDREEMPFLYYNASVVLVPTLAEGFGLPACEAIALGRRVVTGPLEIMKSQTVDKTKVFFCNPHDTASIKQALALALDSACSDSSKWGVEGLNPENIRTFRGMKEAVIETYQLYPKILLREGSKK